MRDMASNDDNPQATLRPPAPPKPHLAPGATFRPEDLGTTPMELRTLAETPASRADEELSELEPGYEIIDEIARGGMGTIHLARQKSLERFVAIKKVRPQSESSPNSIAETNRFIREARIIGALEHPNIVPVHDLHEDNQQVLLAMKLVKGQPWNELLADPTHPQSFHLDTLLSVCNAVAYAHSRGIVHNDLKPHNVLVGEFGEVLVTDWGIAVSIVQPSDEDEAPIAPLHTTVREPIGTPAYVAPELAAGLGHRIGPWTDVYLLGGILFEILSGRPPHDFKHSLVATLMTAVESAPPDFSRFPDIPAGLRDVCRKALARDPEDRYPSITDFQNALTQTLARRDSLDISEAAHAVLEHTRSAASQQAPDLAAGELYAGFAEALAGFQNARKLWTQNPQALDGVHATRAAFAECALFHGDLELTQAQLDALDPTAEASRHLRTRIHRARESWSQLRALSRTLPGLPHEQRLARINAAALPIFDVTRASIWFLDDTHASCIHAHPAPSVDAKPRPLAQTSAWIGALSTGTPIATRDALQDPRLSELRKSLVSLDIHAALYAPVMLSGQLQAILALEHAHTPRRFTRDELDLAVALADQIALTFAARERAEHARMQQDLRTAGRFRQALLPAEPPSIPGLEISGKLVPASDIDGDFYDFAQPASDPDTVYVCVGDALGEAGSGIAAGLVMSAIRAVFRASTLEGRAPTEIIERIHAVVDPDMPSNMTMALAVLRWDPVRGAVELALDGLSSPLVVGSRSTRWLEESGEVPLEPGEALVLYTSGLVEAHAPEGQPWGRERLKERVQATGEGDIASRVFAAISEDGIALESQTDDSVLVVIRRS